MAAAHFLVSCLLVSCGLVASRSNGRCCEEYCYEDDREQTQNARFATKTAYEFIKGTSGSQHIVPNKLTRCQSEQDEEWAYNTLVQARREPTYPELYISDVLGHSLEQDCTPVQFWFLSRHSTRLPNTSEIPKLAKLTALRDEILNNYENRRSMPDQGRLCDRDLNNLRTWVWDSNITVDHQQYLVPQGYEDAKFIGARYQSKFPNLLNGPYSPTDFKFRHTNTERTERTFRGFVEGLFGVQAAPNIVPDPIPANDTLLRAYDTCPKYLNQTYKGPGTELDKFSNSEMYTDVVKDVSTRLGFKFPLDDSVVQDMFNMCRYDKAWKLTSTSPWCAVFTPDQIKILEFREDINYYYKTGYGNNFNTRIGCPPLKDMLQHFTNMVEKKTGPKVVAYFSHSAMMNLIFATMGVAKDAKPLTADSYPNEYRKWRQSQIGSFTTNLAAVLYKCESNQVDQQHQVMFFNNESPIDLPACQVGLCSWDTVRSHYQILANQCQETLDECYTSKSFTNSLSALTALAVIFGKIMFRILMH